MKKNTFKLILVLISLIGIVFLYTSLSSYNTQKKLEKQRIAEEQKLADIQREKIIQEKRLYLLGKFNPSERKDFVAVPLKYAMSQNTMYLRKETYDAFVQMHTTALQDNITLLIASATRNFDYQKNIWEKKWNGLTLVNGEKLTESTPDFLERFKKILEWSAAPGTSRHHWGTDIDINGADPAYFNSTKGDKEYAWLQVNAGKFGFCQTYTKKNEHRINGYNEEKWHWSYMPLSRELLRDYIDLIKEEDITGFAGDSYVKDLDLINKYILSINSECI